MAGDRVTLKASSLAVIEQTQEMLSSLGLRSYYTVNKPNTIKWSNGTYTSRESYDLNITSDRDKFRDQIGFIQGYKNERLDEVCSKPRSTRAPKPAFDVMDVSYLGEHEVFEITVEAEEHSYWTGGLRVSNCTEVTSKDDSDICNLGSINMAQIDSVEEMLRVTELATRFLLAGTLYSDVPYAKVDQIRTKNRRLGLGLMGLHEWMLKRGLSYGPSEELGKYLEVYAKSTEIAAQYADELEISRPVKTRAVAPTGTIGICAETSTGAEPLFCVAYKRRYAKGQLWNYQYVVDPTAKRLIEQGISPESIEDAYVLAEDVERRVAFQAWLQQYVDHSISSTINLPSWGSEMNNETRVQDFGKMLIKYLPKLRGITTYPDGARGGQPLTPISYRTAIKHVGEVFVEAADICDITKGGSCGA
jgi:ribonucleotide reductase alpha subunit